MRKNIQNDECLQRELVDSNYKVIQSIFAFRKELKRMFIKFVFISFIFQLAIQTLVELIRVRSSNGA